MKILVFAVVEESNRFLMIQEASKKSRGKGYFPGGKLEASKTLEEAAARETLEEAGLKITIHGVVHVEFIKGTIGWNEIHVYLSASSTGGSIKRTAEEQSLYAAWKSIREIDQLELRDNNLLKVIEGFSNIEALPLDHFQVN